MIETQPNFIPLDFLELSPGEESRRADEFFELLKRRRTVREYSDRDVPFELIKVTGCGFGLNTERGTCDIFTMKIWHCETDFHGI